MNRHLSRTSALRRYAPAGVAVISGVRSYLVRHHVGLLALTLALGGTAYAASLPGNSVGRAQLRDNAVTSREIRNGSLVRSDFKAGVLARGRTGDRGSPGAPGTLGAPGAPGRPGDAGAPGPSAIPIDLAARQVIAGAEPAPLAALASVGPWRLTYRCQRSLPPAEGISIYVRGPGSMYVSEMSGADNASDPRAALRSAALQPDADVYAVNAGFGAGFSGLRTSFTLTLSAGANQASVIATVTADRADCAARGLAVLAP